MNERKTDWQLLARHLRRVAQNPGPKQGSRAGVLNPTTTADKAVLFEELQVDVLCLSETSATHVHDANAMQHASDGRDGIQTGNNALLQSEQSFACATVMANAAPG